MKIIISRDSVMIGDTIHAAGVELDVDAATGRRLVSSGAARWLNAEDKAVHALLDELLAAPSHVAHAKLAALLRC